jgi:hypothetical protein
LFYTNLIAQTKKNWRLRRWFKRLDDKKASNMMRLI